MLEVKNQPETKPDYFIQIPSRVLYESKLSSGAKLLYGEILLLNYTYGFCSQKNAYFAGNFCVSVRTVENWIRELKVLGLIRIELIRNQNKQIEQRKIYAVVQIEKTSDDTKKKSVQKKSVTFSAGTNKKPYGVNGNVYLSDNEAEEILKELTHEQFDNAVEFYSEWKIKTAAKPRSDYSSMGWAVEKAKHSVTARTTRMTAIQQAGCDVVTDESLEDLPF